MKHKIFKEEFAGKTLIFEVGKFAEQASGAVSVRVGDTLVLATATLSKKKREGIDFFPLVVDYEEKFYAAGRIIGSRFIKREGRPSDNAILTGRLIDRSIRPLFDHSCRNEVQVVTTVLSMDEENDPDIMAILAGSLAIAMSDIPWAGPIGALRISKSPDGFVLNPPHKESESSDLNLVFTGTNEKINMIEAGASQIPEEEIMAAFEFGIPYFKQLLAIQEKIIKEESAPQDKELSQKVKSFLEGRLEKAIYTDNKHERMSELDLLKQELKNMIEEAYLENKESKIASAFSILDEETNVLVHKNVLESGRRPDGRALNEVRALEIEVGVLPRVHGSALFERGQTQALSSLTLGAPGDRQLIESMELTGEKRFMHHYNFPPYSVGEVSPMRGPGRREIGHGALAEKALSPLIPAEEEFPYTVRLVSEILSSNGSSSMASVCGSALALMDGGVPIKNPAAGIALGLMSDKENYKILTDIQGPEDHHGDMDLKVAGTKEGLTALQMDVKIEGVNLKILKEALAQAKEARLKILTAMEKVIAKPREEISKFAPRIITLQIHPDKIREVIGPQGKVINEIIKETGANIDIEDSGLVFITGIDAESAQNAKLKIEEITKEVEVGDLFEGKVEKMMDFGAFIKLTRNKEGLLRNGDFYGKRVNIDDKIKVRVKEIDDLGRINLELAEKPKSASGPWQKPNDRNQRPKRSWNKRKGF
jgi:polyribonucleotide nucleotidyltransferase